jgi:hypothetical protein
MATELTSRFSAASPVSCVQGRYGELIVVQGNGITPARWSGSGAATDAGMVAPTAAPTIATLGSTQYYVARVDVTKPGDCYYAAPAVTFSTPSAQPAENLPAKALAYLGQASVTEVRMSAGGKHYSEQPSATLSSTYGSGESLLAVLDGAPTTYPADSDPYTGITEWKIVQAPDYLDESGTDDYETWYRVRNGSRDLTAAAGSNSASSGGSIAPYGGTINCNSTGYPNTLPYTAAVSAGTPTHAATLRVTFSGARFGCSASIVGGGSTNIWYGARTLVSVKTLKYGAGYASDAVVTVRIPSGSGNADRDIIIEGYPTGSSRNTAAPRYSVKEVKFANDPASLTTPPAQLKGSNYLVAPAIQITSTSGFGAYATCTVAGGKLDTLTLINGGGGYKTPPTVTAVSGGAEVFPVVRPHLRGVYQCYYRFIDATAESSGGPIPSNLSPVTEFDAGEGKGGITWTFAKPTGRATKAELWRSTADQATTLYRVATVPAGTSPGTELTFADYLTDEELRDADRAEYAAMPIVLPNGEVNANRFTPPPASKSAVVCFQDRYWYGVDTSGTEPNTIYYSEIDEPESVPVINELIVQQNSRGADAVTAMVPFGPTMLVMQQRHCFSLTFAKQPAIDAQVFPLAYRGCLSQRCWDIHDGVCYVLDQYGVYSVTPQGDVQPLSQPIDNIFRTEIAFDKAKWCFVAVDATQKVARAFVAFKADNSDGYPTRALCYSLDSKAWWVERYPQRISCATQTTLTNGDYRCVYGGESGVMLLGEGCVDIGRGAIRTVTVTNAGSGYITPPTVTATGGVGAEFLAVLNGSGGVSAVWILNAGRGYTAGGSLSFTAPPSGTTAAATFAVYSSAENTSMAPIYRYKGGAIEIPNDSQEKSAGSAMSRDISLLYQPQLSSCPVVLLLYYNDSASPRRNVAYRNRGVGFVASTVDSGLRFDMGTLSSTPGGDTGVAKALFSGRSLDDFQASDRHVAVSLMGAQVTSRPVVFYRLDVYGAGGK